MSCPHQTDEDNPATPLSDQCQKKNQNISLDDSDLEACLSSWNLVLENPRHLHEKITPVSLLTPKTGLGKSSTFCDEQALFLMHEKDFEWLKKKHHNALAEMEKEKLNPWKKHMENMYKLLEDTSTCLSQTEKAYLEQVKSTQPVLPRVHNTSFTDTCGFCLEYKKDNKPCLPWQFIPIENRSWLHLNSLFASKLETALEKKSK